MADDNKVKKAIKACLAVLNKNPLTIEELIMFYGNLGVNLGTAIAGIKPDQLPSLEDLKKLYYQNPTVDTGLLIQGQLIISWAEDFINNPHISKLAGESNQE